MSIKIVKQSEPIQVNHITVLIYSPPGVGKTSLASSAESPLLLDFDRGAYRSEFRKDVAPIETWRDVSELSESDLAPYSTVVVDTVGRLLDALSADIIRQNPKMKGYGGALSLQGYGALKSEYAGWLNTLLSYGKDIILIAHDKEDKQGDDLIVRPDIQGGSYGEVFKRADAVGYMYVRNKERILDFSPSDRWVGKNSGRFDPLPIPNLHQQPDYMASILKRIKDALNTMSAESIAVADLVEEWRESVNDCKSANDINKLITDAKELEAPAGPQVRKLVAEKAKALGLQYKGKKGQGKYIDPETNKDQILKLIDGATSVQEITYAVEKADALPEPERDECRDYSRSRLAEIQKAS